LDSLGFVRESAMVSLRNCLYAGVAAASLIAGRAEAADLALKRVLLSTGGVGLYAYEAEVEGDATVELKVRLDQVDDVLKSLVVFDDHGGVGGLDLASAEPLAETFRALPFNQGDLQSTPQLLAALRGAEIEVGGPHAIAGRIVAVAEETETKPDGGGRIVRHRVSVMSDQGLGQFVLEDAESVKFTDPAVRAALAKALTAVAASHERDTRTIRLRSTGAEKRKLSVAYLAAAPVWKASYRLVLDPASDATKAKLQGWATLENLSGQDWNDVQLTLVSGRPVAYRQALYRAYMVQRPEAPLDVGAALTPDADRGGVALEQSLTVPKPHARVMGALKAAPAPAAAAPPEEAPVNDMKGVDLDASRQSLAAGALAVAAQESMTQVSFPIPSPVSLAAGRTLSLPIIDADEPVQRIALFDPAADRRHPLSAAELTNDSKAGLPAGIVTIYEGGASGAAYVGDSRLSATPAGETRLLSFALDQKTTIEEDDSDSSVFARATLAKGVLTIEDVTRRRAVFHVKADEPRRLVVVTPKLERGKLTEPAETDVKEAEGHIRVPFDVKAGDAQTFTVTQERTDLSSVGLADLDDANLALYAKSGGIDAATRATLAKLADLRAKQADADRTVNETQQRIETVQADQTRLKDLLGAVGAGTDLQKRYLKKLDADETQLEKFEAEHAQREAAQEAAKAAVEAFVAGM
jgi:hypothetical protein